MKVRIGVSFPQQHVDLAELRAAAIAADGLGVDAIFCWDHFFPLFGEPDGKHFEGTTLLAALAQATSHAEVGHLVLCNSYRNPNLLADIARTIDHISGGRFILGIGSGWFQRDYDEYGFEFGTAGTRLTALEANLGVIKDRWERLNPPPLRRIPILIGGGGEKRTLRITAQHADIWHGFGDTDTLRHKNAVLDEHCAQVGRDPKTIERSTSVNRADGDADPQELVDSGMTFLVCGMHAPYDLGRLERLIKWRDQLG